MANETFAKMRRQVIVVPLQQSLLPQLQQESPGIKRPKSYWYIIIATREEYSLAL